MRSLSIFLFAGLIVLASAASWNYDTFKNPDGTPYVIPGPTVITQGPDLRFYVGFKGRVEALTVTDDYVVTHSCASSGIEEARTVLGITFDPKFFKRNNIVFFVSTSVLEFAGGRAAIPDPNSWAWANGRVDVIRANGNNWGTCLSRVGSLVTGLPVSNHDHGVNGLEIGNNGLLLVNNGGMTNAGHSEQGDGDGGYPATPLSGALLEVDFMKNNFEGDVLYTVPDGRNTRIKNEPDVKIYASGFMNAMPVRVHSNRGIYMTDNGPNPTYGRQSTSCSTHLQSDPHYPDKFLRVSRNRWYGHPNRNRGKFLPGEARQCVFQPLGTTNGGKSPELQSIESSTNGLVEYSANVQGAEFKGAMCFARIGFGGLSGDQGNSFALKLSADGNSVTSREEIDGNQGGLDMYMDRLGSLIVTEYIGGRIKVFRAAPTASSGFARDSVALVSVLPKRGPPRGRNKVIVTAKFPSGTASHMVRVLFGGVAASRVNVVNRNTITCIVPAGVPMQHVHVTVIVNGVSSRSVGAGDYTYMRRKANNGFPAWLKNYLVNTVATDGFVIPRVGSPQ